MDTSVATLRSVRAGLGFAEGGTVPEGLTGDLEFFGAGAAPTPLSKGFFGNKPTPGLALVNSGVLEFFASEKLALKGAKRVVERELLQADMTPGQKSMADALVGPPPPLSAIPKLVALAGNVLVLWDYPMTHAELSNRMLERCFTSQTEQRR